MTALTALVPAAILTGNAALFYRRLATLRRRAALPRDWTSDLSVDRYRPMFRLLDAADTRFLLSQPGGTPDLVNRLRRQRCQVFRGYLRSLERDFQSASDALMMLMIHAQSDRRDILRALAGSRIKFTIGMVRVRCRLALYRWNMGSEPIANLVGLFEGLQLELLALLPLLQHPGLLEIAGLHKNQRRRVDVPAKCRRNLLRRERRHFGFQIALPAERAVKAFEPHQFP